MSVVAWISDGTCEKLQGRRACLGGDAYLVGGEPTSLHGAGLGADGDVTGQAVHGHGPGHGGDIGGGGAGHPSARLDSTPAMLVGAMFAGACPTG